MFTGLSSAIDRLLALQEAVEAARTSDYFGLSTTSRGIRPSINLFQDGDDIVLMAEIPGMKKEEIQLQIKDNMITLAGERKIDFPEKASIHRRERGSQNFSRSMKLPIAVNPEAVKAEYQNGILKVLLPRAEEDKPRMISIN